MEMKVFGAVQILIGIILISCVEQEQQIWDLQFENDLVPEGIAIDPESGTLFLNSLNHSKIVKSNLDGSKPSEFIESDQYGYLPGFGMTIKGDELYALGNTLPNENNRSILLKIDKRTGNLIKSYELNDTTFIYLNDLAISSSNDIYITDSNSNRLYWISEQNDSITVFMQSEEINHCNGIAISPNDKYLYVSSYVTGIRVIDLNTRQVVNEPNDYTGNDGMKYFKNSLIGILNAHRNDSLNGIFRYQLTDNGQDVVDKELILPYQDGFDVPTTFDIIGDDMYFVINTQLDNFDQQTNEISDSDKLTTLRLMKKNLNN
ncbi:MAG: SMP-30/gluconolactonase/LRE family protein [Cyclobacteriaceae bacterium]